MPLSRPPVPLRGLADGEVSLLSPVDAARLVTHLPSRCVGKELTLVFSTQQHGYSLATLLRRARGAGPTLLVVMDDAGGVCGGFAARDWGGDDLVTALVPSLPLFFRATGRTGHTPTPSAAAGGAPGRYFGSGETFLFSLRPALAIHRWSRRNNHFQLAAPDTGLAFGGGGGGFGLHLDAGLERGETGPCDTFGNPPLLPPSAGDGGAGGGGSVSFRVVRVEVWAFTLPAPARKGAAKGR